MHRRCSCMILFALKGYSVPLTSGNTFNNSYCVMLQFKSYTLFDMKFNTCLYSSLFNNIIRYIVRIESSFFYSIICCFTVKRFHFVKVIKSEFSCQYLTSHYRNLKVWTFFLSIKYNFIRSFRNITIFSHYPCTFQSTDTSDYAIKHSTALYRVNMRTGYNRLKLGLLSFISCKYVSDSVHPYFKTYTFTDIKKIFSCFQVITAVRKSWNSRSLWIKFRHIGYSFFDSGKIRFHIFYPPQEIL